MEARIRQIGDVAVLDLDGSVTIGDGDVVLRERVDLLLEQNRRHILLNLAQVFYLDSCGLAEMIWCQRRAREQRAEIKLLSPSDKVRDLLKVTRLDLIFETFRDEREALASFARPPLGLNTCPA